MRLPAGALLLVLIATHVSAQQKDSVYVRVRVIDPSDAVVPDADITISRGLNETIARGMTDAAGRRNFSIARDAQDYQVSVRRIGFVRAAQFFTADRDTIDLSVRFRPQPTTLATGRGQRGAGSQAQTLLHRRR